MKINHPLVEVRQIDYFGEPMWTVFVDGYEQTCSPGLDLPCYTKEGAEDVADEVRADFE